VGDLSRLIDPTEPRKGSVGLPTVWTSESRLWLWLEKTFLMLLRGGEAIGDTTGDDCIDAVAMLAW
jgi:hypothetical protein